MREWWRGAVIYQIYPRSFLDRNGDGIGDLPGILERLDHVASLGADAIWVSPFFRSPMTDFGYDVEDYRDVDPMFGTLDDFDRMRARARELGLRVIIDLVLNHTASTHPWFKESRASRTNDRADWYVWADPRPDGTPPNNWLSIFGGPAWTWEPRRGQYYLHQFLSSQPDLNLRNRVVQDAVLDVVRFWMERGVDGIRLDACNHFIHDAQLRSNPARETLEKGRGDVANGNPYAMQWHRFDRSQPENLDFLRRIRALLDEYPERMAVAEIGDDFRIERSAEYVAGNDLLHTAYSFALLGPDFGPASVRAAIEEFEAQPGGGWPSWAFSNHDVQRVRTRWGGDYAPDAFCKMTMALLCSLRGSVFVYQGEELGLNEADVPVERMLDPYGIAFWPEYKGRDGCRTPMPWDHTAPNAGFSTAEPPLPIPPEHVLRSVSMQDRQPDSVLNFVRRLLAWRRSQPALLAGSIRFRDTRGHVLAFEREADGQRLLLVFNLGGHEAVYEPGEGEAVRQLEPVPDAPDVAARRAGHRFVLPAYGVLIAELERAQPLAADEAGRPPEMAGIS